MAKKRQGETWDSDDDLLQEDAISTFTFSKAKDEEEELDENALLGIGDESGSTNKKDEVIFEIDLGDELAEGEEFEIIDPDESTNFDDSQEVLDYEDTALEEEDPAAQHQIEEHDPNTSTVEYVETENQVTGVMEESYEAPKPTESDSDSEGDETEKRRERFHTERGNKITLSTGSSFIKGRDIPDNLEISQEQQQEIESFMQKKTQKQNKQLGKFLPGNARGGSQQGARMQQRNNQQSGGFRPRNPNQNIHGGPINQGPGLLGAYSGPGRANRFPNFSGQRQPFPDQGQQFQGHGPPPFPHDIHHERMVQPRPLMSGQPRPGPSPHHQRPGRPSVHFNPNFRGPVPDHLGPVPPSQMMITPNSQAQPLMSTSVNQPPMSQHEPVYPREAWPPHQNPPGVHDPRGPPDHRGPRFPGHSDRNRHQPMEVYPPNSQSFSGAKPLFPPDVNQGLPGPGIQQNHPGPPRPLMSTGDGHRDSPPGQEFSRPGGFPGPQNHMRPPQGYPRSPGPRHQFPSLPGQQNQGQGQMGPSGRGQFRQSGPQHQLQQQQQPQRFQAPQIRGQRPQGPQGFGPRGQGQNVARPLGPPGRLVRQPSPQGDKLPVKSRLTLQENRIVQSPNLNRNQNNSNITLVQSVGQKRHSSTEEETSPAKVTKKETPTLTQEELMEDETTRQLREAQKKKREEVIRRKEQRRQQQAAERRETLKQKLAEQGRSLDDLEAPKTENKPQEQPSGQGQVKSEGMGHGRGRDMHQQVQQGQQISVVGQQRPSFQQNRGGFNRGRGQGQNFHQQGQGRGQMMQSGRGQATVSFSSGGQGQIPGRGRGQGQRTANTPHQNDQQDRGFNIYLNTDQVETNLITLGNNSGNTEQVPHQSQSVGRGQIRGGGVARGRGRGRGLGRGVAKMPGDKRVLLVTRNSDGEKVSAELNKKVKIGPGGQKIVVYRKQVHGNQDTDHEAEAEPVKSDPNRKVLATTMGNRMVIQSQVQPGKGPQVNFTGVRQRGPQVTFTGNHGNQPGGRTVVPQRGRGKQQQMGSQRMIVQPSGSHQGSGLVSLEGLPHNATEDSILEFCSSAGPIQEITIIRNQNRAIVRFVNPASAKMFAKKYQRRLMELSFVTIREIA